MTTPTAEQVANRAQEYAKADKDWGTGFCLRFSRTCAGAPAGTATAVLAWHNAKYRHAGGVPPRGSFVFWSGGGKGHGHIAVSDGRGYVWSTDIRREGRVDRVTLSYLAAKWPSLSYLGWSEDVNGVRIAGLQPPVPMPTVRANNIAPGLRNEDVKRVQLALRRRGYGRLNPSGATGFYGAETRNMALAFQKTWDAKNADGYIGKNTLRRLGFAAR